jgi:hypothetical protein
MFPTVAGSVRRYIQTGRGVSTCTRTVEVEIFHPLQRFSQVCIDRSCVVRIKTALPLALRSVVRTTRDSLPHADWTLNRTGCGPPPRPQTQNPLYSATRLGGNPL